VRPARSSDVRHAVFQRFHCAHEIWTIATAFPIGPVASAGKSRNTRIREMLACFKGARRVKSPPNPSPTATKYRRRRRRNLS